MAHAILTDKAPMPNGASFSQAIVTDNCVYVAGQSPRDPGTMQIPDGIAAQTKQVLQNMKNILEAAGTDMTKVVKVSVFLADINDFAEFSKAYAEFFAPPYPARTTTGAQLAGFLVEMDAIAVR